MTLVVRTILKNVEEAIQMFVHFAHACQVIEAITVVGSRPNCRQFTIKERLKAFLAKLMCAIDPDASVRVEESFHDVCPIHVPRPSVRKFEA